MSNETTLAVNDIVKFAKPLNKDEAAERYVVLELRGDRTLVGYVCDLPIPPTTVFPTADLVKA